MYFLLSRAKNFKNHQKYLKIAKKWSFLTSRASIGHNFHLLIKTSHFWIKQIRNNTSPKNFEKKMIFALSRSKNFKKCKFGCKMLIRWSFLKNFRSWKLFSYVHSRFKGFYLKMRILLYRVQNHVFSEHLQNLLFHGIFHGKLYPDPSGCLISL